MKWVGNGIDFQIRFVHILRQIARGGPWEVHPYLTLSDLGGSGGADRAEIVGRH